MQEGHFRREEKISRKQAERLILDLANYSDWQHKPGFSEPFRRFSSLADLSHFFRKKIQRTRGGRLRNMNLPGSLKGHVFGEGR